MPDKSFPSQEVVLRFELRPLDPNQRVSKTFAEVRKATPELESQLSKTYPGARVLIERDRRFPGAQEVWHFVVRVVHDPTVQVLLPIVAKETLLWLKSKAKNTSVAESQGSKAGAGSKARKRRPPRSKPKSRAAKGRR